MEYDPSQDGPILIETDIYQPTIDHLYEFMVSTLVLGHQQTEDDAMQRVLFMHANAPEAVREVAISFMAFRQDKITQLIDTQSMSAIEAEIAWSERVWQYPIDLGHEYLFWLDPEHIDDRYMHALMEVEGVFLKNAVADLQSLETAMGMANGLDKEEALNEAACEYDVDPAEFERRALKLAMYGAYIKQVMLNDPEENNLDSIDGDWHQTITLDPYNLTHNYEEFWEDYPELAQHIDS